MGDEPVRIGVLGAGDMGSAHAAVLAAMPDVKLIGVFSRDAGRARRVAESCQTRAFVDTDELIRDADAIDVCVPSAVHQDFVIPALAMDKDVFCETPLALELEAARNMRDAARRSGRLLQVGLLMRSIAQYAHVKSAVESGVYGPLRSILAYRLGSYLRADATDHKPHYSEPSTELMTFDFDFVRWLMGQPVTLSAAAVRLADGTPGEISAVLDFGDGRQATVLASGIMPTGFAFTAGFRALFDSAVIELHNVFEDGPPKSCFTVTAERADQIAVVGHNPYEAELRRFIDCVRGRADTDLLDADRAIEALLLSLATQRSLSEARTVALSEYG